MKLSIHKSETPTETLNAVIAGFGDEDSFAQKANRIHKQLIDLSESGEPTAKNFLQSDAANHFYAIVFLTQKVHLEQLSDSDRLETWRKIFRHTQELEDELALSGLRQLIEDTN